MSVKQDNNQFSISMDAMENGCMRMLRKKRFKSGVGNFAKHLVGKAEK